MVRKILNEKEKKTTEQIEKMYYDIVDGGKRIKEIYLCMKEYMTDEEKDFLYRNCREFDTKFDRQYEINDLKYSKSYNNKNEILEDYPIPIFNHTISQKMSDDFELMKKEADIILKINLEAIRLFEWEDDYDHLRDDYYDQICEYATNTYYPHHTNFLPPCNDQVCCNLKQKVQVNPVKEK